MSTLSTHVLDTATGMPATGMRVVLRRGGSEPEQATTDDDGRIRFEGEVSAGQGTCTLRFETGAWAVGRDAACFFPYVEIAIDVDPDRPHHHVPLLLSPFAYSTYRGS